MTAPAAAASTANGTTGLSPGVILQTGMAFCGAQVLLSAVEIGLFTALSAGPATEPELRERLGLHPRGSALFLAVLAEQGMLERDGDRYRNSAAAAHYLVRGKPSYMGAFLRRIQNVAYPAWGSFTAMLKTGSPQAATYSEDIDTGDGVLRSLYERPDEFTDMMAMTESLSAPVIPALAKAFDWGRYQSLTEVGGARGNVTANLVKAHPHLRAVVFDMPEVEPAFDDHMARLGMQGQVSFRGGDFFADKLPEADVLLIGHTLVDHGPEQRRKLLANTLASVRPGGVLLVYDPMIAPGPAYVANLLTSLNLQVLTPGGSSYAVDDCRSWLSQAGYARTEYRPLDGTSNDSLVIGYR